MAFMEPFTYFGAYYRVETVRGDYIVPTDVVSDPTLANYGLNPSPAEMAQYSPEGVGPVEADDINDITIRRGWYGRYSAPGYLYCTDWETADSEAELLAQLRELYGNDDDSDDDDSDDDAS